MKTLLLDQTKWDLVLDSSGNIALASEPYAIAQDVASACRLFLGELYYNIAKGIPFFTTILGKTPPLTFVRAQFVAAALTVPLTVKAKCIITSFINRQYKGQILFTDVNRNPNRVSF